MASKKAASNITAPTRFLEAGKEKYAYRRCGGGSGLPLLCLQHFTGIMDNWDPAVTDPLASGREVILFESAGIGRSSGSVPKHGRRHGFLRAAMGKRSGTRKPKEIDEDHREAAALASLAAPYRHARLSAMKLAGDPNNPARIRDDASLEELRAEMMKHLGILIEGGLIDLEALPAPNRGIANQPNG
jgi:hypothetical protein